jgi:hypothetical protein
MGHPSDGMCRSSCIVWKSCWSLPWRIASRYCSVVAVAAIDQGPCEDGRKMSILLQSAVEIDDHLGNVGSVR